MRVKICAVGRLRTGPERALYDDYAARFDRIGRGLGLGPLEIAEVEARRGGGATDEAERLRKALPDGAVVYALDETGHQLSSPDFAAQLARWRDQGRGDLALMIGGADGLTPDLRDGADFILSLGKMVWPHLLARVMLAEQLYRAATILAGSPYHRA